MTEKKTILQAEKISYSFNGRQVLFDINLSVNKGEFVGIIGPNGAGKSTLLKLLLGLLKNPAATVLLDGKDVSEYDPKTLARLCAYVPQSLEMPFSFNVHHIVRMGRFPYHRPLQNENPAEEEIVDQALERLDLLPLKQRWFNQLSGGEQQRTLIASALVQQAPLLFLDEPTSALDLKHQQSIFTHLRNLVDEERKTIILVTHDINLAAQFCDRLLLLSEGRLIIDGPPNDVLQFKLIQQVYGVKVYIDINPFTGSVYILPYDLE